MTDDADMIAFVSDAMGKLSDVCSYEFGSQRTSADQIEHEVRRMLMETDARFIKPVGVRASGDLIWDGKPRIHINIKTTDLDRDFHMPNLISADNLWRLFDRGDDFFLLRVMHRSGAISGWELHRMAEISWDNLQLAALGSGQIQIRDGAKVITVFNGTREEWMAAWKVKMLSFYRKEIDKITKRMGKWQER